MQLSANSLGENVPRRDFDARVHSSFERAVNLKPAGEDGLVTLFISADEDLPAGIRIWAEGLSLAGLRPGTAASLRGGLLRFAAADLTVDVRSAETAHCTLPAAGLDMSRPVSRRAWWFTRGLLNEAQAARGSVYTFDGLFAGGASTALGCKIGELVSRLLCAAVRMETHAALSAAAALVGLGPGLTPAGDDLLVGFLAGLYGTAVTNAARQDFLSDFCAGLAGLAGRTGDISRVYLLQAASGRFSSRLTNLAAAIETGAGLTPAVNAAFQVGHSSGMDAASGLLAGLAVSDVGLTLSLLEGVLESFI